MDLKRIEQHVADLTNIKESLREEFIRTGNPTIKPIVEMAMDVVRRIEDLEWELTKLSKS